MQQPVGLRMSTPKILWLMVKGEKFDPLTFALNVDKNYGGISYNELGPVTMYQITKPSLIHEILVEKADKFHKADRFKYALKSFAGNGLILSEGDFWKRQRKLAQPAFHMKRVESYAQTMVDHTLQMMESWKNGDSRYI